MNTPEIRHAMELGFLAISLALAIALAMTTPANAAPDMQPGAGGPPVMVPGMPFSSDHLPPYLNGLELSDSQRARITEILKTQGASLREKAEAGRKTHDKLRQLAFSADYSDEKAKVLADAAAPLMAELAVLHAGLDRAVFAVLTPEQQQQAKENLANFKRHFPKR
jgi:Spy/CpxP family protein refolding chaperone